LLAQFAAVLIAVVAPASRECPAPTATAVAIRELASRDWSVVTAAGVRGLWLPQRQDQQTEAGVVRYRWRMAGDVCECCDLFVFWSPDSVSGRQGLELAAFRRTVPTFAGAMAVARLMLEASGTPADEWGDDFPVAPTLRAKPLVRAYSWEVERPRAEIRSINIEVLNVGRSWMVYCAMRREAKHR
jgi:hypothetical protein